MSSHHLPILLVEDEPNDVFFLQHAFEEAGIQNPLQVVEDGQKAIDYLAGNNKYADRAQFPFPALVLLDLKLPIRMGLDVLRWIQTQPLLAALIVVVLSSANNPRDVEAAYQLGARSYLVKPASVKDRLRMAKAIKTYWLELNEYPAEFFSVKA